MVLARSSGREEVIIYIFKGGKDEVWLPPLPTPIDDSEWMRRPDSDGVYGPIELQDVVVKPSENDKKLLDITKKMYKDPYVRHLIYRDVLFSNPDENEQAFNDRLLNYNILYGQSGFPNISVKRGYGNYKFRKTYDTDIIGRNHYNPVTNTMHIGDCGFIPEISHAFQYNNNINTPLLPGNNISGSKKNTAYSRLGSTEHIAHSTIEPQLRKFLNTGNKKYLKKAKEKD